MFSLEAGQVTCCPHKLSDKRDAEKGEHILEGNFSPGDTSALVLFLNAVNSEMPWDTYFCLWEKLYDLKLYDIELSGLNNIQLLKAFSLVSAYFQYLKLWGMLFCLFACFILLLFFSTLLALLVCLWAFRRDKKQCLFRPVLTARSSKPEVALAIQCRIIPVFKIYFDITWTRKSC